MLAILVSQLISFFEDNPIGVARGDKPPEGAVYLY